jgi:signal transduction histidine kinase
MKPERFNLPLQSAAAVALPWVVDDRERLLVEAVERRLTRLGFDLHDGAIQDVAALASDVRLLREQLRQVVPPGLPLRRLLGRADDLEARLIAIDAELRALARAHAPAAAARRLPESLHSVIDAFARRSGARVGVEVSGDFDQLTASQQIAVIRIVQEALANVTDHSDAREVAVTVVARAGEVHARVVDDGQGFDVEETLLRAAKEGRLGLVGMSERVRLLGGRLDVESRPGGPTAVSVTLARWRGSDDAALNL